MTDSNTIICLVCNKPTDSVYTMHDEHYMCIECVKTLKKILYIMDTHYFQCRVFGCKRMCFADINI